MTTWVCGVGGAELLQGAEAGGAERAFDHSPHGGLSRKGSQKTLSSHVDSLNYGDVASEQTRDDVADPQC